MRRSAAFLLFVLMPFLFIQCGGDEEDFYISFKVDGRSKKFSSGALAVVTRESSNAYTLDVRASASNASEVIGRIIFSATGNTDSYWWNRNFSCLYYEGTNPFNSSSCRLIISDDGSSSGIFNATFNPITVTGSSGIQTLTDGVIRLQRGKPPLTGTVTILGNPLQGQILRANTAGLGGSGVIMYQWKRDTTNVGKNTINYTLVSADVNKNITVTVSRADNAGTITSAPVKISRAPRRLTAAHPHTSGTGAQAGVPPTELHCPAIP